MRAAVRRRWGAPREVIEVVDLSQGAGSADADAPLASDAVVVQVRAAGLNSLDWRLTRAQPGFIRLAMGVRRPREPRIGEDLCGVVTAVGRDVTRFAVGDRVVGQATGAFAESVVARERNLVLAPESLGSESLAALPVAGVTALQALELAGEIAGRRVLVIGASGGVGSFCVQLAVARGARVTGVCGTASVEHVRSLGAERVIDYRTQSLEGTYDAVIELASVGSLRQVLRHVAPHGRLVLSSGDGGFFGPLPRIFAAVFQRRARVLSSTLSADRLAAVVRLADEGALRPVITARYPLERVADAVAHIDGGHVRGKVVLDIPG